MGDRFNITVEQILLLMCFFLLFKVPAQCAIATGNCSKEIFNINYENYEKCVNNDIRSFHSNIESYLFFFECEAVKKIISKGCCNAYFVYEKLKEGDINMSFVLGKIFQVDLVKLDGVSIDILDIEWITSFWKDRIEKHVQECPLSHQKK